MPLEGLAARAGLGGMSPEGLGLYKDLEPFWERIGGDAIYTEAVAHVDALWRDGVLQSWADAATIVAAHDPHPGIVEGTEGFEYDIVDEAAAADEAADAVAADHDGGVPPVDDDGEPQAMVGADDGASKPVCLLPYVQSLPHQALPSSPTALHRHYFHNPRIISNPPSPHHP